MKHTFISIMGLLLLPLVVRAEAPAQAGTSQSPIVVQEQPASAFKGTLLKVWNKFRVLSPRVPQEVPRLVTTTAGIRGAETTSTILQPYWKDDRTGDERFIQQMEQFSTAQTLMEKGQMEAASKAFSDFMATWPESDLKANAQFALGLAYGGLAKKEQSIQAFNQFVKDYPQHPLAADAKEAMAALQ